MAVGRGTAVFVAIGVLVGTAVSPGVIVGHTSVAVGGRVFVGCGVWVAVGELVMVGKKRVGVETAVAVFVDRIIVWAGVICAAQAVTKKALKSKMIGNSREHDLL